MSIKSKVLAGAATLALVGGVGTAGVLGAGTASAATPSCGIACVNLFSYQFGTHTTPNFTVDVLRQGEKVGQPIILFRTANYDPALDWTVLVLRAPWPTSSRPAWCRRRWRCTTAASPGSTSPNCPFNVTGFTFPPAGVEFRFPAFENEYAPFGVDSGLCMGVAATAVQRRGRDAAAVWRLVQDGVGPDTLDQSFTAAWAHGYFPLINGSDTNFSQPFVLTYPASGVPTDKPRPQLFVSNLTGFSFHVGNLFGTGANSNQLWGATFGELK